jgi:hypothetical protein
VGGASREGREERLGTLEIAEGYNVVKMAARALLGATLARWRRLENRWAQPRALEITGWLVVAAGLLLFLDSAATFEVGFTMRLSYLALVAANVVGFPWVVRGWARLPVAVRASAAALVALYIVAALFGDAVVRQGIARTTHRELVYLGDLVLGLGTIGLVVGLRAAGWPLRRLAQALVAGLFVAAAYVLYQWPAQHYGWPLADINNAPNSDNFSFGHRNQGLGLFNWERPRGTFKEPLILAAYMASVLPVGIALALGAHGRIRRALLVGLGVCLVALTITASSLTWGISVLVALFVATTWALASARPRQSAVLGAVLIVSVCAAPVMFTNANVASGITGRTAEGLQLTASSRSDAWQDVGQAWAGKPILGHGPGQSSVLLAYRPDPAAVDLNHAPLVLGSAYGLWAAALLDAGLAGLTAWVLLLGSLFVLSVRALMRKRTLLAWGATAGAVVAVSLGQVYGDRFDLKVWLLLALMAAATCVPAESNAAERRREPDAATK